MPWFENESDLNDPQGKILCRAYGMIEIKNGVFDQIKFKPWPRIITNLEINSWGHRTHVFGKRKDAVFRELKSRLVPFGISRFYTDNWGAYERNIEENEHEVGKQNTQKIEITRAGARARSKPALSASLSYP